MNEHKLDTTLNCLNGIIFGHDFALANLSTLFGTSPAEATETARTLEALTPFQLKWF